LAEFAGAFARAVLLFTVYHAKWVLLDPGLDHKPGIFSTFPAVP
jgi:glycerol uptake facilitator protein